MTPPLSPAAKILSGIVRMDVANIMVLGDSPERFTLSERKHGLSWETGERQRQRIQQVDVIEPAITVSRHRHRFAHARDVPWHPRGKGPQVVLATNVSTEGAQRVVLSCSKTEQPHIEEFGRVI